MIGAAAAAAAATTAAGLVEQVARLAGRGAASTGRCWRSAGQRQVSRHFVADDADTLGREETDVESPFSSPPHTLFRRRHVDDGDHITHLATRKIDH